MATLLIVDDEANIRYSLEKGLRNEGLEVMGVGTAQQAMEAVASRAPDALVLDLCLPDMKGLEAFDRIHQTAPRLPVVIVTAHATTETAIEAMKRGAFEYLVKPVDLGTLREVIQRAMRAHRTLTTPVVLQEEQDGNEAADCIIGMSAGMQDVYKKIGRVAPQDVTVLVLGESGTGKELVARAIVSHSRRSEGPFLAINCAAIPETLLESELFGHERGAFTGADRRRIGKFEQAHGGTVFLDEIGDMTLATQAKILRLLQDGQFQRVGGNETIHTDVRAIAATNKNLEAMIRSSQFREDLYYRLEVFSITIPPLRARMEDLPMLVHYFTRRFGRELRKTDLHVPPETLQHLQAYDWPGNVRELQSAIQYAIVQASGDVLAPECLPPSVLGKPAMPAAPEMEEPVSEDLAALAGRLLKSGRKNVYREAQMTFDRVLLEEALRYCGGNQVLASQILGISRTTLRAKLNQLGMMAERPTPQPLQP
jgi:nitrogen regulation protein NR(I)